MAGRIHPSNSKASVAMCNAASKKDAEKLHINLGCLMLRNLHHSR